MRSITFVHEIQKEFTEDIISNQGLNTVSFPDRWGKGSRQKRQHEQSQTACEVCTGGTVWSAQKLQQGRVSDKAGKISRRQTAEKSKEISTTKL